MRNLLNELIRNLWMSWWETSEWVDEKPLNELMRNLWMKWSELVAVGQNFRSISSQAGQQLLNVLVTLTLSHISFNYDTDHRRVWITLSDWHCGLETFMLGSRSEPMQSSITACSTGLSTNHLHHHGDDEKWVNAKPLNKLQVKLTKKTLSQNKHCKTTDLHHNSVTLGSIMASWDHIIVSLLTDERKKFHCSMNAKSIPLTLCIFSCWNLLKTW